MDQTLLEKFKQYYSALSSYAKKRIVAFITAFVIAIILVLLVSAPSNFPNGSVVTIESGQSLQEISQILYKKNIIRSPFVFRATAILLGGEKKLIAGDYLLARKETSVFLAFRIVRGQFDIPNIKLTIPEGWNVFQIADYLQNRLTDFDKVDFISQAKSQEGYLFPDTYFVPPTIQSKILIKRMRDNFDFQMKKIHQGYPLGKSQSDVVIMASILEGEALPKDRAVVAGILWKRISLGMPLQVDSTFIYINGKNTYDLTLKDLQIDSPYNTYKYKGLPPGPISNPGLDAIRATATPTDSPYLYFLTSRDGTIHYAKTFTEHVRNKVKYIN